MYLLSWSTCSCIDLIDPLLKTRTTSKIKLCDITGLFGKLTFQYLETKAPYSQASVKSFSDDFMQWANCCLYGGAISAMNAMCKLK